MRVLLDECAPYELKKFLKQMDMIARPCGKPGGPRNLRYQQNFSQRKISVLVLVARSNRVENLRPYFEDCVSAINAISPGEIVTVGDLSQ